ncbi:MAG: alpha/beta hydrolase [Treponema sp.]|nr:alpha/beta hydrolase [Treponema sp.]
MMGKNVKIIFGLMIVLGAGFMTSCTSVASIGSERAKGLSDTEKVFIDVNGSVNGMFITMTDENNPVLLFISGGPGVPQVWLNEAYQKEYPNNISKHFTVCWWDYLGEGLSYNSKLKAKDISLERLASDAHAVAEYLKDRFKKDKIYLMAHSSGTNLGLYLAQTNSQDFYCYFGMGQDYVKSDRRYEEGYYFMKEIFEKNGDKKALKEMNKLVSISDDGEFKVKKPDSIGKDWEKILLKAGCATTREMRSDVKDIFFKQMSCKCYTMSEKINYWKGKALLGKSEYRKYSVEPEKPSLIPVYFLSGYYDYTTPITLSKELYEKLEAPDKAFYTFNNSAHSPLWEENQAVIEAMLKHVR